MINKFYLQYPELIRKQFAQEGAVVLFDFITPEFLTRIKAELFQIKYSKDQNILTHSYNTAPLPLALREVASSPEFNRFISSITKQKTNSFHFQLISTTWKDYTLLHDSTLTSKGYDLVFDFTEDWDSKAGGFMTYADGSGQYTILPIHHNLLALINRKYHPRRYLRYCNHYAQGKRRFLLIASIP